MFTAVDRANIVKVWGKKFFHRFLQTFHSHSSITSLLLHWITMTVGCLNEQRSKEASIVLSLWFFSSGLAAVTGNAVVLWLFFRNESLRAVSNRFLASLSVADFLVGIVIDPIWITFRCLIQPSNVTQAALNEFMEMLRIHTTAATTLNLCCVSVDRFIAIRFPFRYQDILTKKTCHSLIAVVWFISLLLPCPVIFVNVENLWLFVSLVTFCIPTTVMRYATFGFSRPQAIKPEEWRGEISIVWTRDQVVFQAV